MVVCIVKKFMDLRRDERLHLPKCWDARNFEIALTYVLDTYVSELRSCYEAKQEPHMFHCVSVSIPEVASTCGEIKSCVQAYHNGFPARTFLILSQIMKKPMQTPLDIYQKTSVFEMLDEDKQRRCRVRKVDCGIT